MTREGDGVVSDEPEPAPIEGNAFSVVGVTPADWHLYCDLLSNRPSQAVGDSESWSRLLDAGLVRRSLENATGFAAVPAPAAWRKISGELNSRMTSAFDELARLELEVLRQGGTPAESDTGPIGVERYPEITNARERMYDLGLRFPGRKTWNIDSFTDPTRPAEEAYESSAPVNEYASDGRLAVNIFDAESRSDSFIPHAMSYLAKIGEQVLTTNRVFENIYVRDGCNVAIWEGSPPERGATMIATDPTVVELATHFVTAVVDVAASWPATDGRPESLVCSFLADGGTDENLARSAGWTPRTTSRRIAETLEALGSATRFAAGVDWERRRWAQVAEPEPGAPGA